MREVTYDKRIFSIRKTHVAHFAVYLGKMIGEISEKLIYIWNPCITCIQVYCLKILKRLKIVKNNNLKFISKKMIFVAMWNRYIKGTNIEFKYTENSFHVSKRKYRWIQYLYWYFTLTNPVLTVLNLSNKQNCTYVSQSKNIKR